ncbi:MAG: division/cell wall cluster transcriptional repressor MraZ [Christensenellales bacterium]
MMLIGTYNHQLDAKNRFRIPTKLKTILGEELVLTKGTQHCLFLFSATELQSGVVDKSKNISMFDETAQKSLRLLLSSAFELETDNQGRTLLPQNLKEFANINKDIILIGVGNRVEIWAKEVWENYSLNMDYDAELSNLKDYGV